MPTVADALRQHAPGYLDLYGPRMPTEHKRVLALITACRTGGLGFLYYRCDSCPRMHLVARSCGNRHCPNCQSDKARLWLAKRTAALLPGNADTRISMTCRGNVAGVVNLGDTHGSAAPDVYD